MADGPVTGGYPRIGVVAKVDQPVLAQLRSGGRVRFLPYLPGKARLREKNQSHWIEKMYNKKTERKGSFRFTHSFKALCLFLFGLVISSN